MNVLKCFGRVALGALIATSAATLASAAVLQKVPPPSPVHAPEIAPELITCAIVLAVGGLFILTDRLRRPARN